MKAINANATFLSNVYEQNVALTDWSKYQVVMTGGANQMSLRANASTSTSLVVLDDVSPISSGSTIHLSTDNGNTISSSTIGGTTTGSLSVTSGPISPSTWQTTTTVGSGSYSYSPPGKLNYDGSILWALNNAGTSLIEYSLTPGNAASITPTGKSLSMLGQGFDFSADGRYFFRMSTTASYTIERFTLGTPWDISTVMQNLTITKALTASNPNSNNVRAMKISTDGTKLILINQMASSGVYTYVMSVPWDIETISSAGSSTYSWFTQPTGAGLDISPDGKVWYFSNFTDSYITTIYVSVAATPWDSRTLGTAVALTTQNDLNYTPAQVNASWPNGLVVSGNGKHLLLLPNNYTTAYQRIVCYSPGVGKDWGLSKNIDISGFNLTAPPTNAWFGRPTISAATAPTATKLIKTKKYLDMSVSSTTSATVSAPESGLITVGSTVLLDDLTPVTVTGVTETLNGSAYAEPGLANDYIKWYNKSFNAGVTPISITVSNDGFYMYIIGTSTIKTTSQIFQYALSTAYDVTTATLINTLSLSNNSLFYGTYTTVAGFDIVPDGSGFIVLYNGGSGVMNLRQYKMLTKHNLATAYYYADINPGAVHSSSTMTRAKFNLTGTQIEISTTWSNNNHWFLYMNLSTPYDITTAGAMTHVSTSGSLYFGYNGGCFSADGLKYYVLNTYNTGSQSYINTFSATVAHNLSTVGFSANSVAGTNTITFPGGITYTSVSYTMGNNMFMTHNGLFMYLITSSGIIYQFSVRTKAMTKYDITFATQATAPTSVYLPTSTFTDQTFTASVSGSNLVFTGSVISPSSSYRAIQLKVTNNQLYSEIQQLRVNMEKL